MELNFAHGGLVGRYLALAAQDTQAFPEVAFLAETILEVAFPDRDRSIQQLV